MSDAPLMHLRRRAKQFLFRQKQRKQRQEHITPRGWAYHNTFLGRPVVRNAATGEFRIIGGQVEVNL